MSCCGFHSLYFRGVCLASWNYRPMSFIKFGKNSGIIYSNSFSVSLSFSSSFGIPMMWMLIFLLSPRSLRLLVSSGLFFSVVQIRWITSLVFCSQVHWFYLLSSPLKYWAHSVSFYFCYWQFSAPWFTSCLFFITFISLLIFTIFKLILREFVIDCY